MASSTSAPASNRRAFLAACSTLGLTSTLLPGLLWGKMVEGGGDGKPLEVTAALLDDMVSIAGLDVTASERDTMLRTFQQQMRSLEQVRQAPLENWDPPALVFSPVLPGMKFETARLPPRPSSPGVVRTPKNIEDVAFYNVRQLGALLRSRRITATALTQMYLARLRRYDPMLHF